MYQSPIHKLHVAAGATFTTTGDAEIVSHFTDAEAEVDAARTRAAIFDRSHVGRIRVRGKAAWKLLNAQCDGNLATLDDNRTLETTLGEFAVRVVRLEKFWVVITAAADRAAVLDVLCAAAKEFDAKVDDQTTKTVLFALVGPEAKTRLASVLPFDLSDLNDGDVKVGSMFIANYVAIRHNVGDHWAIGIMLPNMLSGKAWQYATQKAGDKAFTPAGEEAWTLLTAK
ncbi:MAG: hypothetical protein HN909_08730 [Phycisphaerales bacterium]|jgi:aminomethyltransferase|nr:hypothetical protein [Phycisphaerales bacterium]MBT7171838.1 hypothetical protein [Phycisphaerales bacterium]